MGFNNLNNFNNLIISIWVKILFMKRPALLPTASST